MLRVTPIYGSRWDQTGVAQAGNCTLVEYADVRVLINVGLHNPDNGKEFWSNLPPHDCLVITDSTLESIGSLPLYVKGQQANKGTTTTPPPMYATYPTVKMGQMTLYSHHADISLDGSWPGFSLEELDSAFAQLRTIKYSQSMLLPLFTTDRIKAASTGPNNPAAARLSVTMHRAGHVVGAAYLVLQRLQDETRVVISSTYSLAREDHLEGSNITKFGTTPDVLVSNPGGPACPLVGQLYQTKKLKDLHFSLPSRQQKSIEDYIMPILRRSGNVLLPVDASGRVVELLFLLNKIWERQRIGGTYNLIWLGSMTHNTLDFLRSQLEWMNDKLSKQFENSQSGSRARGQSHPLSLQHVKVCTNLEEMEKETSNENASVVLAVGLSMDHGPSRDVLLRWADNDNNAILFTDSSSCILRSARQDSVRSSTATSAGLKGQKTDIEDAENPTGAVDTSTTPTGVPAPSATAGVEVEDDADGGDGDNALAAVGTTISEDQMSKYTTAFQLIRRWCQAKMKDDEMEDSVQVDVFVPRRSPLVGNELKAFVDSEERKRRAERQQEEEQAMLREVERAKGRLRLGEDGVVPDASTGGTNRDSKKRQTRASIAHLPFASKKKSRFDSSLFLKFSKPLFLTFSVREDAVGVGQIDKTAKFGIGEATEDSEVVEDDYGISVRPEHFVDIVSGVDPSRFAGGSGRIGDDVRKRGLGFSLGNSTQKMTAGNDNEDDDDEDADERGLEAADLSEGTGIIRGRNGRAPSKITAVPKQLEVLAEIEYIPFEGRISADMARQTVKSLQPRCCIVLGGPKIDTRTEDSMDVDTDAEKSEELQVDSVTILASSFQGTGGTPSDGETLALSIGHAAYDARLLTIPFRTKAEKAEEEMPPEPIELYENKIGSCTVSLLDYVATGQKLKLDGSIVLAPKKTDSKLPALYVSEGDVQLTTIAEELTIHGMKPIYSSHEGYTQLIVNGVVIVKKMNDTGKINVEGPLCQLFFDVRKMVLQKYVVLE